MKPEELSLQGESNLRELHEKGDNSSQHPLQLPNPLQDLLLDRAQFGQDLQRWAVLHLVVDQLLVAVEAEVVALAAAAG